jgi:DNA polymerase-3 subunit epsilon
MTKVLTYDTETTGKWNFNAPPGHPSQPHLVQLGAILEDYETGVIHCQVDVLVDPNGEWEVSEEVSKIHGITNDEACKHGILLSNACYLFRDLARQADIIVAHNLEFDKNIMTHALLEAELPNIPWEKRIQRCTMRTATNIVKAPNANGRKGYKWPTLNEAHMFYFNEPVVFAHTAMADAMACRRIYGALEKTGAFT